MHVKGNDDNNNVVNTVLRKGECNHYTVCEACKLSNLSKMLFKIDSIIHYLSLMFIHFLSIISIGFFTYSFNHSRSSSVSLISCYQVSLILCCQVSSLSLLSHETVLVVPVLLPLLSRRCVRALSLHQSHLPYYWR